MIKMLKMSICRHVTQSQEWVCRTAWTGFVDSLSQLGSKTSVSRTTVTFVRTAGLQGLRWLDWLCGQLGSRASAGWTCCADSWAPGPRLAELAVRRAGVHELG